MLKQLRPGPSQAKVFGRPGRWAVSFALCAVALLSTSGSGMGTRVAGFPGSQFTPTDWKSFQGCGKLDAPTPTWSGSTGISRMDISATSKRCGSNRGGLAAFSSASSDMQNSLAIPVRLPSGSGGINVTWNLSLLGGTKARYLGSGASCPWSTSRQTYYNRAWGVYTLTYNTSLCYSEAYTSVYAGAVLEDLTQGIWYYPSNYWNGLYNQSGVYNQTTIVTWNYSSPAHYSSNHTSSYGSNYSIGPTASMTGAYSVTMFINGTFTRSDKFEVLTFVNITAATSEGGFTNGLALAYVDLGSGPYSARLEPFSIW